MTASDPHTNPQPDAGHLPGAGSDHAQAHALKLTVSDLVRAKRASEPLVMVTAYDYSSARIAEAAGVDMILVGDSAAMVMLGHSSTTAATMEQMLLFAGTVVRTVRRPFVIGDMPFMSFQPSDEDAVRNAGRFIAEAGVDAVKLEGGGAMIDRARAISAAGIAVVGHLGLTPQSAAQLGGYRAQARSDQQARQLLSDAHQLEAAGAVCIVVEAIPAQVAEAVTQAVGVPVIGIGAGSGTDGQVLVYHDVLGLTPGHLPRFVRQYADLASVATDALREYAQDVRKRVFPATEHTYSMPPEEAERFQDRPDAAKGRRS